MPNPRKAEQPGANNGGDNGEIVEFTGAPMDLSKELEVLQAEEARASLKTSIDPLKAAEAVQTAQDRKERRGQVSIESITNLGELKDVLKEKNLFDSFFNYSDFRGESYSVVLPASLNFRDKGHAEFVKDLVKKTLDKEEGIEKVGDIFGLDGEGVKEFLAAIYTESFLVKVEEEFGRRKEYFEEFKKGNPSAEVSYKIDFPSRSEFTLVFVPKEFEEGYKKKLEEKKKEGKQEPKKEGVVDSKEAINEMNKEIEKLNKNFIVKLVAGVFGLNTEDKNGITGFQRILSGNFANTDDAIAAVVLGFIGVPQFKNAYEGAKSMLADKYRMPLERREQQIREGKFGYKKMDVVAGEKKNDATDTYKKVGGAEFVEVIKNKKEDLVKQGLKLEKDFELRNNKKLEMDLSHGGRVVFAKGAECNVNGKIIKVEKGEEKIFDQSDKKVTIVGKIPKGTAFVGKLEFKIV